MMRRHIASLEMHFRGPEIVAGDEAEQYLGEESSFSRAQSSHDAKVDRYQASVGVDEQIAGVHVGMKKAITKRVAQEGLDQGAAEPWEIQVPRRQRRTVAEWRAVDPLHRQHIARRIVPFHPRHAEIRIVLGVL